MHFFGVAQVNATDGQCCAAFDRYRVLIGRTTPRASSESYSVARTPRNVNFRTKFIVYAAAAAWLSKGGNTKRQTAAMANLRAVAIKRQIAANKTFQACRHRRSIVRPPSPLALARLGNVLVLPYQFSLPAQ